MASLSAVFIEAKRTNWLKAWLAVDIAKSGLEQFVDIEAKTLHTNIYNTIWSRSSAPAACKGCHTANLLKCPTQGVCKKRGAHGNCTAMHDNAAKQPRPCPINVCNKVHDEIVNQHIFSNPSWKNTSAQQWAKHPWEIAKCYFPPDGYVGKTSVQDTDFNGLISFMMNCKHFNNMFSFAIAVGKQNPPCLLKKARELRNEICHPPSLEISDQKLQEYFTTLIKLLSDSKCLAQDKEANTAVLKLDELQNERMSLNDLIELLKKSHKTLKDVNEPGELRYKEIDEILAKALKILEDRMQDLEKRQENTETEVTDLKERTENTETEVKDLKEQVQILKDLKEPSKSNIQAGKQIEQEEYERGVAEMLKILKTHYKRKLSNLTFSPLNDSVAAPLDDFYMQPNIQLMKKDKGCFIKTGTQILLYKNLFSKDSKLNQQTVFIQGEAGSGKSTFLARLVMDWCDSPKRSDNFFQDLKTLKDYKFIFLVTLRNSVQEFNIEEIIKQQVIDSLYGKEDCEKANKLLNEIMKQEHCLILLDGLDEWTGPGNDHNLPELKALHYTESRCDLLITTRPWKLADGKIKDSEIDILLQLEGIKYPFELSKCILRRKYQDENVLEAKNSAFTEYIRKQKLEELLQSPMMLSVIVCWHDEGERKLISKCEIYSSLIDSLLKKVSNEEGYFEDQRFNCFAETQYIQPNIHHVNQIAEAAFRLLFSDIQEKSLVFGAKDLKLEDAQRKFALKAGILTKAKTSSLARSSSTFSFVHKSIQEFLAAYYIACNEKVINEIIAGYFEQYDKSYLAMTQLFIFLCGVSISAGNALSDLMNESNVKYNSFQGDTLYQNCVFAGYREAVANSTGSINLRLTRFIINDISLDLKNLWNMNVSNVMSLTIRLPSVPGYKIDLSLCHKLKSLQLEGPGIELKDSASVTSLEFPVWIVQISTDPSQCTALPSIEYIRLEGVKCSYTLLCSLLSSLLTLDHQVQFELIYCEITSCVKGAVSTLFNTGDLKITTENKKIAVSLLDDKLWNALNGLNINSLSLDDRCKAFRENHKESLSQTLVLLSHLDKLSIVVDYDTPDQWKTLHGLNIKSLNLHIRGANHAESLSQSLASLKQLEMLSIDVDECNRALWEALHGLGIKSLSLSGLWSGFDHGLTVKNAKSLKQSILSLKQLETLNVDVYDDTPGLWEALQGLSIKSLSLSGQIIEFKNATSLKKSISSLKQLETLDVSVIEAYSNTVLWEAIQGLSIKSLRLSCFRLNFEEKYATSLKQLIVSLKELNTLTVDVNAHNPNMRVVFQSLNIKSLSLNLSKNEGFGLKYATSLKQLILSLKELETLSISVDNDSPGLREALQGLSIKSLRLRGIDGGFERKYEESLEQWLSSLTKLDPLNIRSMSMSLGSK
ncbi:NLR family CARD domain-containing protein 4-like isoform X2 [Dreissena polymorpha]|uniref:NLR family CARD domain-containing protein 4-like isoform X2 n=1 Tax=Dreissena polymorpha TaxID=45954 RepID=UPI002264C40E|nr:NLR family CARD domain-containing protein 4-like isoform X2 [Dreissena polymorpha]